MSTPVVGAHVDQIDPIAAARERSADVAQFFLGDPQGWKAPVVAYAGGAEALRADAAAAGIGLYVHAPYVINVATSNNRIRIPSRKLLQQHVDGAAEIGARARDRARRPCAERRRPRRSASTTGARRSSGSRCAARS